MKKKLNTTQNDESPVGEANDKDAKSEAEVPNCERPWLPGAVVERFVLSRTSSTQGQVQFFAPLSEECSRQQCVGLSLASTEYKHGLGAALPGRRQCP